MESRIALASFAILATLVSGLISPVAAERPPSPTEVETPPAVFYGPIPNPASNPVTSLDPGMYEVKLWFQLPSPKGDPLYAVNPLLMTNGVPKKLLEEIRDILWIVVRTVAPFRTPLYDQTMMNISIFEFAISGRIAEALDIQEVFKKPIAAIKRGKGRYAAGPAVAAVTATGPLDPTAAVAALSTSTLPSTPQA